MTQGLIFLLGIGTWIGALILAGVLANIYFIVMTSKRTFKDGAKSRKLNPQGIEQPKEE
jgi:uncharacterized membrane protein YphA (DoxX/SURF4 family)